MKLWKILVATMIALLLVSAVAMAATCDHANKYVASTNEVGPIPTAGGCVYYTETTYKCPEDGCAAWSEVVRSSRTDAHDNGEAKWHDATCLKGNYKTETCKVCGYVTETAGTIAATGHSSTWVWTKDPTCTEKGLQKLTCSKCGTVEKEAEIAVTAHDWAVNTLVPATCTEKGKANYKCQDCGKEENEHEVPAENHKEVETIAVTKADCASWEHKVTAYNKCKKCGEITYKATKNAYDTWVGEKVNGCGVEGYNEHYKCSICDAPSSSKVIYPALTHDYTIQVSYTPATCLNDGVRVMQCKVRNVKGSFCDKTIEIVVPATGHTHSDLWQVKVPATCTEEGIEENLCKTCGLDAQYRAIAKKNHNFYTAKEIIANFGNAYQGSYPDCENDGYAYAKCKNNGCQADHYVVLPALGHTFGAWNMKAYDCEKGTVGERVCACGEKETKVFVEGTGHKWVVSAGVDATCEVAGVVDRKCSVSGCTVVQTNVYVPAKGHDGEVTEYVAPTCTAEGSKTTKCATCKKVITETIAKLDHKYEWVTTPATPSANGKSEYKCACGDVKETKTIKYTKWYYNNTITSFGPTTRELVGGNDWYRVTPVDLTVDGVYTYDLIASNKYVVGKVTITVNAGALTVSYKTNYDVDVKDEALLIYASKADLATGTAVTAPVGAAINAAETFGADTKVLVSLVLTGDYDAAGKGLVDASAAAGMIANID